MRRIGDFSQGDFEAMKLADQMQALAVGFIKDAYLAEEDINIDNLTLDRFLTELDKARSGGPIAQYEFNRQLSKVLMQVVPSVMNPPEEAPPNG